MAEEHQGQEKTEEPTQRKITKAREEGQVARSRELSTMVLVTMGALGLFAVLPWGSQRILGLTETIFRAAVLPEHNFLQVLGMAAEQTLWVLVPFLGILFFAGAAASVATGGFVLSAKSVAFKSERLSPIKGFKRMFSVRALMELGKSVGKFLLIAGVAVLTLVVLFEDVLNVGRLSIEAAIGEGLGIVALGLVLIGSSLVLIAVVDVPFQAAQHRKQLKMTKQEVKDELKDTEGKPEVRSRIRQAQQEIAQRRMLQDVADADVVITNPEHYAVALRYDAEAMGVPVVLAKGADLMALRIRELANAQGVPVLRAPALTRAVYYVTEIGGEIPAGLYRAVAQVLAYVFALREYRSGRGEAPPPLGEVDVPSEFRVEGSR